MMKLSLPIAILSFSFPNSDTSQGIFMEPRLCILQPATTWWCNRPENRFPQNNPNLHEILLFSLVSIWPPAHSQSGGLIRELEDIPE